MALLIGAAIECRPHGSSRYEEANSVRFFGVRMHFVCDEDEMRPSKNFYLGSVTKRSAARARKTRAAPRLLQALRRGRLLGHVACEIRRVDDDAQRPRGGLDRRGVDPRAVF